MFAEILLVLVLVLNELLLVRFLRGRVIQECFIDLVHFSVCILFHDLDIFFCPYDIEKKEEYDVRFQFPLRNLVQSDGLTFGGHVHVLDDTHVSSQAEMIAITFAAAKHAHFPVATIDLRL